METASQYIIDQISLTVDRFPEQLQNETFDIKGSVVEVNIYESVELPYLSGSLAMVDDVAFKSTIGIKGTERVLISIKPTKDAQPIVKKFLVTGIAKEISINERTDVRVLTLLEEHAYLSSIEKVSRAFEGTPSTIIKDVLFNYLDKNLTTFKENDVEGEPLRSFFAASEAQGKIRYISPYQYPLDICDTIRDRMTTSIGAPYFLFSTLRDEQVHLLDLETIMKSPSWNSKTPYNYAQGSSNTFDVNDTSIDSKIRSFFHVKKYTASNFESTLKAAQSGSLGSAYKTLNILNGYSSTNNFHNGSDTLNEFLNAIDEPKDTSYGFDKELKIGSSSRSPDQTIANYESKAFSNIVAGEVFYDQNRNPLPSYHDIVSNNVSEHKLKIKSAALRSMLLNNKYTIVVPGPPYITNKSVGVGCNIDLNYAEPTLVKDRVSTIDKNRSGKFMIYRAAHRFKDGIYDVTMDIVKLTGVSEQ